MSAINNEEIEARIQVCIYLDAGLSDFLDLVVLAERKRRGNRSISRSALVREALAAYLPQLQEGAAP